jgi:hypothetical protein
VLHTKSPTFLQLFEFLVVDHSRLLGTMRLTGRTLPLRHAGPTACEPNKKARPALPCSGFVGPCLSVPLISPYLEKRVASKLSPVHWASKLAVRAVGESPGAKECRSFGLTPRSPPGLCECLLRGR